MGISTSEQTMMQQQSRSPTHRRSERVTVQPQLDTPECCEEQSCSCPVGSSGADPVQFVSSGSDQGAAESPQQGPCCDEPPKDQHGETSDQHQRRKAIQEIMKSDVSQKEKNLAIQELHHKHCCAAAPVIEPSASHQVSAASEFTPTYHVTKSHCTPVATPVDC